MNHRQRFQLKSALYTIQRIDNDLVDIRKSIVALLEAEEYDSEEEAIDNRWDNFLVSLEKCDDSVLYGIFKNMNSFHIFDDTHMNIFFPENFEFFRDWLNETAGTWRPLLYKEFGTHYINCFFK